MSRVVFDATPLLSVKSRRGARVRWTPANSCVVDENQFWIVEKGRRWKLSNRFYGKIASDVSRTNNCHRFCQIYQWTKNKIKMRSIKKDWKHVVAELRSNWRLFWNKVVKNSVGFWKNCLYEWRLCVLLSGSYRLGSSVRVVSHCPCLSSFLKSNFCLQYGVDLSLRSHFQDEREIERHGVVQPSVDLVSVVSTQVLPVSRSIVFLTTLTFASMMKESKQIAEYRKKYEQNEKFSTRHFLHGQEK